MSLHVRRGDKVDVPTASGKYASLAPSWYATALEEISRRNGSIGTVYVFSDDPEWCRSNLAPAYPTVVVEGNSAHDDLHLMSLCRHHVIANSTFSWWAAWLDPRADKIVIAPATWRRDRTKPDAVPPGWIQIEN